MPSTASRLRLCMLGQGTMSVPISPDVLGIPVHNCVRHAPRAVQVYVTRLGRHPGRGARLSLTLTA